MEVGRICICHEDQTLSASYSICLVISILIHTSLLITANKYKPSTYVYVGLRHHMIARHALFSYRCNMYACVDFTHTGTAFTAVDYCVFPIFS